MTAMGRCGGLCPSLHQQSLLHHCRVQSAAKDCWLALSWLRWQGVWLVPNLQHHLTLQKLQLNMNGLPEFVLWGMEFGPVCPH